MMKSDFLKGKRGLVMGVTNDQSIAWGMAQAAAASGAELAFTYQWEPALKRVEPLAEELGVKILLPCDVREEGSIKSVFDVLEKEWGELDFVIHSIAFSKKVELDGRYVDTSRKNFLTTMNISVYSFTEVAHYAKPLMKNGGSLVTLSYYGAEQVIPNYNVMGVAKAALEASVKYMAVDLGQEGIRVNAISAGPIQTMAASGISDFDFLLKWNEVNTPLNRTVTQEEVGRSGLFLLSDLGSGVTGEVLHVDSGYHTVGMIAADKLAENIEIIKEAEKAIREREEAEAAK